MYSRKSVRPRVEPWRTPALTGCSWEDSPSRTIGSSLLLRKEKTRQNICPEIPQDLCLWRRPAFQILLNLLDISSATAPRNTRTVSTLAILSATTVSRSAVIWEVLKSYWISEKSPHFCGWSTSLTSFTKALLTLEWR